MIDYLAIDTNSIVCFFEGGFKLPEQSYLTPPESLTVLENLLTALEKNKIHLIISEIVIIEIERIKEEKKRELTKLYSTAVDGLRTAVMSNKQLADHAIEKIRNSINLVRDDDIGNINKAWKLFEKIRTHKNTSIVDLNEQILLHAYKRGLMGKKPHVRKITSSRDSELNNKPIHDIQPDSVIIESIKSYIKDKQNIKLFLCTNDSNFYEAIDKKTIDPEIKQELHLKGAFRNISDFLNKILKIKQPKVKAKITHINTSPIMESGKVIEGKVEEGQRNVSS